MKTLTLGPPGTYSHHAAENITDDIKFVESVTSVVEAVAKNDFDRGVVPIENSIEGSVTETLDALAAYGVAVINELLMPLSHALMARSRGFETVVSHKKALAQCRNFLVENYPDVELQPVASTAKGIERATRDDTIAAIGHPSNAIGNETPLQVLAENIEDQPSNATRFFHIGPPEERSEAGRKSSFIVYPDVDYPGLLLELIRPFADRNINMTRVESRPSGERLGDYVFHLDVESGLYEKKTQDALADIEAIAADDGWIRRLGSYDSLTVLY